LKLTKHNNFLSNSRIKATLKRSDPVYCYSQFPCNYDKKNPRSAKYIVKAIPQPWQLLSPGRQNASKFISRSDFIPA